ncbi:MAG: cytochrome c [Gammaproteobacteria bacterium]|nr:cytochrome c [Pseudomonadales bacterium]MCP5347436.1 cytochrome c [Pseudomonadales bacterium]
MSEQLALDSARLNTLLFDLHRTETVLARERQQQASRIAASARSLQDGARKVLDLGQALPLADNSDTRFRTLAAQLESEADILATQAEMGQLTPTQMEETLSRLNDTCNACHSLYRDRAGTLR